MLLLFSLLMCGACSDISFDMPKGPKGDDGKSAYDIWVEQVLAGNVDWPEDRIEVADFLVYIKGEKGDKGEDGKSAYELWKELIASGTIDDPHNPSSKWDPNRNTEADFWDFLTGRDGKTPHIGDNGNWFIGDTDTKVPAKGQNGLSSYEEWKDALAKGEIIWNGSTDRAGYFLYLKGDKGEDGKTPTIEIDPIDGTWIINGEDTNKPSVGADGKTPTISIGSNGNWFIDGVDTGNPSQGEKGDQGENGSTPEIGPNGNWWIDGKDTGLIAIPTVEIGVNGNWYINGKDTGLPSKGENGVTPEIKDGYWWIGDKNTNVPATGAAGEDGAAGKSAYELWKEEVEKGKMKDPANPDKTWPKEESSMEDFFRYMAGSKGLSAYEIWKADVLDADGLDDPKNEGGKWPTDRVSEADFYDYLTGKDGKDGASAYALWLQELESGKEVIDPNTGLPWPKNKNTYNDFWEFISGEDGTSGSDGKPAEPGKPGEDVKIVAGVPNVIAQYYSQPYSEYVNPEDGSVAYKVYDREGRLAPEGTTVSGLPGISGKTYTVGKGGLFVVPDEDLSKESELEKRWGETASVTIPGETPEKSAKNTYVPNPIEVRIVVPVVEDGSDLQKEKNLLRQYQMVNFVIQRKTTVNGEWENLPFYLLDYGDIVAKKIKCYLVDRKTEGFQRRSYDFPTIYDSPSSIHRDKLGTWVEVTGDELNGLEFRTLTRRLVKKNTLKENNNVEAGMLHPEGGNLYYTIAVDETGVYGKKCAWNGVAELPEYPLGPNLKDMHLYNIQPISGTNNEWLFSGVCTGVVDAESMRSKAVCDSVQIVNGNPGEFQTVMPKVLKWEQITALHGFYKICFGHAADGSAVFAWTKGPDVALNNIFEVPYPGYGSAVNIFPTHACYFCYFVPGKLEGRVPNGPYYLNSDPYGGGFTVTGFDYN